MYLVSYLTECIKKIALKWIIARKIKSEKWDLWKSNDHLDFWYSHYCCCQKYLCHEYPILNAFNNFWSSETWLFRYIIHRKSLKYVSTDSTFSTYDFLLKVTLANIRHPHSLGWNWTQQPTYFIELSYNFNNKSRVMRWNDDVQLLYYTYFVP